MIKLSIALALALTACGGGGEPVAPPVECSVDVFGDSLFYGPTLTPSPATSLTTMTGVTINDHSQMGRTLANLIQEQTHALAVSKSHIVVIELGGNDSFKPTTADEYEQMIHEVRRMFSDRHILFITFVPLDVIEDNIFWTTAVVEAVSSYNTRLLSLADTHSLDLVRWDLVPYAGWQVDTIDGVHRTQAAMDQLLIPLARSITTACETQARHR